MTQQGSMNHLFRRRSTSPTGIDSRPVRVHNAGLRLAANTCGGLAAAEVRYLRPIGSRQMVRGRGLRPRPRPSDYACPGLGRVSLLTQSRAPHQHSVHDNCCPVRDRELVIAGGQ